MKLLTKEDLLRLQKGDKFFRDAGIFATLTECEVISNSKKELIYNSNVPGIGWYPSKLIYKDWDSPRNQEVFRVNGRLDSAKYYQIN